MCIALLLLLLPLFARATVFEVFPGNSIQAAVNVSTSGDTVLIHDGTYAETVVLYGKSLVVGSSFLLDSDSTHISQTIIRPDSSRPDTQSCFVYAYDEDARSVLCGLTLRDGRGTKWARLNQSAGGAVYAFRCTVTITDCSIFDSHAQEGGGVALVFPNFQVQGNLNLSRCRFKRCTADFYGGGVYASFCSLRVANCDFDSNSCITLGAALWMSRGFAWMDSCRFAHGRGLAGGLSYWESTGHVRGCLFEENGIAGQGALDACDLEIVRGNAVIQGNHFRRNATGHHSVTLDTDSRHPGYMVSNVFEDNVADISTGTLIAAHGPGDIAYNIFRNNFNSYGAAVYVYDHGYMRIHHNIFERNVSQDTTQGSVCLVLTSAHPTLDSNVIRGNGGQTIARATEDIDSIDARNNWWGDPSGPYHPTLNPAGRGDTLLWEGVRFVPWLTSPPDTIFDAITNRSPEILSTWEVLSLFPNPFNSSFQIALAGFAPSSFRVELYDILGRRAAVINEGAFAGGPLVFTAPPLLASGIYFLFIGDKHAVQIRKVLFMK